MRRVYECLVCVDDEPLLFPVLLYLSYDKLNMPTSNRIHNTTWRQIVEIEHYDHKNLNVQLFVLNTVNSR